jgi:hypothetical protein
MILQALKQRKVVAYLTNAPLGYIKELLFDPDPDDEAPDPTATKRQQPEAYAAHESSILSEFSDVLMEVLPPGLPPKRTLRNRGPS